jgi:RHS repeat-associated protein
MIFKYIHGPGIDEVISMTKGGASYYYHYDGLGSVTSLTDSTGATSEAYSYDTFGQPSATSTIGNRYMFTGREYDSETGLYYYRARQYDARMGRFLQRDPVGYAAGVNLYGYCYNNPVIFTDPLGLDILVLNDSEGARSFGHNGYAVGNDGTGWDYYSKNGKEMGNAYEHYLTKTELLNSKDETGENKTKKDRYDRSVQIKTSPDQDQKMKDYSNKHYNEEYDLLFGHNCDDLMAGAFDAGGVLRGRDSTMPNRSYEEIKKANSVDVKATCKK